MFGTPPKIGVTSLLLPPNMIAKLKTGEELKVALDSIQVLSNENVDDEGQIIEKK